MKTVLLFLLVTTSTCHAQETKTAIGFTLSPGYTGVRYDKNGTFDEDHINDLNELEQGKIGLSGNLFFQYELHERVFLNWGFFEFQKTKKGGVLISGLEMT